MHLYNTAEAFDFDQHAYAAYLRAADFNRRSLKAPIDEFVAKRNANVPYFGTL
jgi:hypothetical protein